MKNIFNNPKKYLKELNETNLFNKKNIEEEKKKHSAYSLACVWPTKLCPLGCETCFFRSSMDHKSLEKEEYQFSNKGLEKLITFINDSNNGYLMLSGGGDPMICPDLIEKIIRDVKSKRIIVITSGFWGKSEKQTKKTIDRLYEAIQNRKYKGYGDVVLRISIDAFHRKQIGNNDAYKNIINVFRKYYKDAKHFSLLFHSLRKDTVVEEIANEMNAELKIVGYNTSDNKYVNKIMVEKAEFKIEDYTFPVSYSKLFNSNVMVDLTEKNIVEENIKIINEDMKTSEQNNPTYVLNMNGEKGTDYWINYNGNVTSWMNQDPDNIYNVYKDSYKDFIDKTFNNPMSLYLIKYGYPARNEIISEVNPLAVVRAKTVNIRDYYATLLLRERNTKLYYYIRCIQHFIEEGYIQKSKLKNLSIELRDLILSDKKTLIETYNNSNYDILKQELNENKYDKEIWLDWITLVKYGQYEVDTERFIKKIAFLNKKENNLIDIENITKEFSMHRYNRISETMSPIDKKLLDRIIKER